MTQKTRTIGRRDFLKATAATTAGFTIVNPQSVRGSQANSAVRLGILGVGGRGTEVGSGFVTNAGVRVTALADLFGDQLDAGRKHFDELQGKSGEHRSPLAALSRPRLLQADRRIRRTSTSSRSRPRRIFIPCTSRPWSPPASTCTARSRSRSTCLARSG